MVSMLKLIESSVVSQEHEPCWLLDDGVKLRLISEDD